MHPLRPHQVQELQAPSRRELLWNVSEPGDPYDIKKSMIAKMPGDKKIFMGNHLDLVCLLQAAQIQRLVEFLQDYKLKFREIERSNLDRHSYEIQIKELTQRLADEENFKNQNAKLVEFIKRQQLEIQFLQKNSRDSNQSAEGLKNTYERSLQIANQLTNENNELKRQLQDLRLQVMNLKARYEALQKSKNKQIEELKLFYAQSSREGYESSLNSLKIQYESQIRRYDLQVKRLKELNDAKNSEINDLMSQREDLVRRLTANEGKADLQRQLYEYQNKFVLFGQQIERLNIALRDYTNKLEESEMRKRELQRAAERNEYERREAEGKLRSKDSEIAHLSEVIMRYEIESKKLGENQQYLIQYEQQISSLQRDVVDLNSKLKYQSQVAKKYKQQTERLNFELSKSRLLEKQNYELRGQAQELASYRRKIAESENRAAILKEEIERLKSIITSKDNQLERTRSIFSENENSKLKIRQLQNTIVNKYEFEISRIKADYDQKIELITRKTGSEIQGKSQFYQNELEKINEVLRLKTQEAEKLRTRNYELQTLLSRSELETSAKLRNYEANIAALKRENEELFNKIRVLGQTDRKAYELQSKLAQYQREIDRITQIIRAKDEQILNLRNRLRETEGVTQKYESDISRKVTVYEQTISSVRSENDQLRRKLNELISQSNRKILEASQEIDRLGKNLLKLKEEKNQLQLNIRQASQQIEFQRQRAQKISAENQELRRKLAEAENKYQMIYSDSTGHLRALEQENQALRRQLADSKGQMSRVSISLQQTLANTGRENQNLKAKLIQLSQQFERLNGMLKNKTDEYNQLQAKYRKTYIEYETTVKQFREYEISIKTKYEGQVSQNYANYERTIQSLKADNEDLRRKIIEFQNKYRQFYQESSQELDNLRRQLSQKDSSYSSIQLEYNKKVSIYESNVVNLTKVNQELQKKLKDLDLYARQRAEESSRLQALLMTANSDLQSLKRQWKDSQYGIVQKYDAQLSKRQSIYEQNLSRANAEIEDIRRKLQQVGGDSSRRLSEFEVRYSQLSQEYDKLKSNYNILGQQKDVYQKKTQAYQTSIANYENEVKRRIQAYEQNINNLNKENQDLRRKLLQYGDLGRRNAEYESKIALMSQQIERLHANLKNLGQENETLRRQINEKSISINQYELEVSRKVTSLQQGIEGLQRENNDLKRKVTDYEQRLYAMSQELERVNNTLKSKSDETLRLQQTIKVTYEQTIIQVRRENEELNRKLKEAGDVNRKYNQLENNLVLSSQEIERLTQNLRLKQEELMKLDQINRNQANDLESWRRKFADMEANYTQTFEVEVTKKYSLYEQSLADLRKKNAEYESKLVGAMQEIERLNNVLRLKVQESSQLTNKVNSFSLEVEDYRRKLREVEGVTNQQYTSLKNQRDDLYRKIQQLQVKLRQNDQAYERKLSQYENRIKIMTQQIQRLNEVLRNKNAEFEQVKRQFKEYQQSVALEVKGNYGQYEATVGNLNKEIDELRRKLTEVGTRNKEYESKLIMTSQEIDRLDNIIKIKSEELGASKRENEELRRQYEELRRRWEDSSEVTRRIPEYEQKISLLIKENQRCQYALREKTEEVNTLNNKLKQFQLDLQASRRQLNQYEVEINRKVSGYEQGIMQLRRENEDLLRRKGEYQSKIALMSQQLQRLNGLLKSKNEEFLRMTQQFQSFKRSKESEFNQNYTKVVQENELAKKHLIEYEESIRKLHAEFERLQTILHQLKQERDKLIQKNRFLSTEISRLTGENKDLEEQARDVRLRLTDQTALQKRITEHLSLMVILFAEIETLRQRVRDKQMEVVEVRKSSLAPNMV